MTEKNGRATIELIGRFVESKPRVERNGFTLAIFGIEDGQHSGQRIEAVGFYDFNVVAKRTLRIAGELQQFRGKTQIKMESFMPVTILPTTNDGTIKFLRSLKIPGVAKVTIEKIVERYGAETFAVLDAGPVRLIADGFDAKKAKRLCEAWAGREERARDDDEAFFYGLKLSVRDVSKVFEKYGKNARQTVEANPYALIEDISGVGFKKADRAGEILGIPFDSDFRILAGIVEALRVIVRKEGHCYAGRAELGRKAADLLKKGDATIAAERIDALIDEAACGGAIIIDGDIVKSGDVVYTCEIFDAENFVARDIAARAGVPVKINKQSVKSLIASAEADQSIAFTDEQKRAIFNAVTSRVSALTGGPGTGKTTITRGVCDVFESLDKRVALGSFTARAARRLQEAVSLGGHEREAKTIHSLLVWNPRHNTFFHDEENPLPFDVVIIDEASMLSLELARDLLAAIPRGAQIVFIGDDAQLPSIQAGAVLRDLIESKVIPVSCLSKVFRQGEGMILQNTDLIRSGRMPILRRSDDFQFIEESEPGAIADHVLRLVTRDMPARGFKPSDIQVLTPQHKGDAGTLALNRRLQAALNPPRGDKAELSFSSYGAQIVFRAGDRVMQTRNNYPNDVINGQTGVIVAARPDNELVDVLFDGHIEPITYGRDDYEDQLMHGFCQTIHKSQGSEYLAVVLAFHSNNYEFLNRNLLYTALTRAKQMAVIVGTQRNIAGALGRTAERRTGLQARLKGAGREREK